MRHTHDFLCMKFFSLSKAFEIGNCAAHAVILHIASKTIMNYADPVYLRVSFLDFDCDL